MELKVSEFQVPEKIDINFEELKQEVAVKMADYKDLVYTDEEVPKAKKDLATMRKFIKALDEARKNVKAELLKPYGEFEAKLNAIKVLVEEPIYLIDKQVKDFEDKKKSEKAKAIADYYNGLVNKPPVNILDVIASPKWANTTYSMAQIQKEIDDACERYFRGVTALEQLTTFKYECIAEFNKTLDLSRAIMKQAELIAIAEMKRKAIDDDPSPREWIPFEALMNNSEIKLLKEFFEVNEIQIRPVQ